MSEMRRATWSGLDGHLVLRREPRRIVSVAAELATEIEIGEPVEPQPLATLPAIALSTPQLARSRS